MSNVEILKSSRVNLLQQTYLDTLVLENLSTYGISKDDINFEYEYKCEKDNIPKLMINFKNTIEQLSRGSRDIVIINRVKERLEEVTMSLLNRYNNETLILDKLDKYEHLIYTKIIEDMTFQRVDIKVLPFIPYKWVNNYLLVLSETI